MKNLFSNTKVVCVSKKQNFDVYIGRKITHRFDQSVFHNPFRIGYDGDRAAVILKFIDYWYAPEQRPLRECAVLELTGRTLACWCSPFSCHGDIIAGYLDWKHANKS